MDTHADKIIEEERIVNEIKSNLDRMYIPTLRIVMTSACNGECFFCHREGASHYKKNTLQMRLNIIENQILPAINAIGINKVIFTGGEPTLHDGIATAIRMIKTGNKNVQVGITTNGLNIGRIFDVKDYIDRITISSSSLKEEIFMHYTKVNPLELVNNLRSFNKAKKSVSIVITKENANELGEMIDFYMCNGFDIKLQFIISDLEMNNINWQQEILYRLMELYGEFDVKLGATPVLCKEVNGNEIRIKLASLNAWMYDNLFIKNICMQCEKKAECIERGCAVRVFPDGKVTPCLSQLKSFSSNNVFANLEKAYRSLEIGNIEFSNSLAHCKLAQNKSNIYLIKELIKNTTA